MPGRRLIQNIFLKGTSNMEKYIIAHDLGTTANKATLFSTDGRMISSAVRSYDTHYFNDNWAEQNPEDWWEAVCETTASMARLVPPEDVLAISFSGHMMGCLAIDDHGKPLRPHILWSDMRATRQMARLLSQVPEKEFYAITGHRASAAYTLEKIMWVKDNEPEVYARTACFIHPKDYMVYRLTGRVMSDFSDASGTNAFDINTFEWSKKLLDCAGVDIGRLPKLVPSITVAGTLLPEAAAACGLTTQTKVVLGAGDGATASVGAGSVREGITYGCMGTSAWIGSTSKKPLVTDRRLIVNWASAVPGLINPIGTMQAAGASFSWLKNQICTQETAEAAARGVSAYDLINEEIAKSPAGSNGILFLPYLLGERAPRWNSEATGCFVGLKMVNSRCDVLRSVVEGIGYNLRIVLDEFTGSGLDPESIALVGGMAKGAVERQIFADIWNHRILKLNYTEEAGSIGAAVIGGVGIGVFDSFDAVNSFWQVTDTVDPDPANAAVYEKYLPVFNQTYESLLGVYTTMAGMR